MQYDTKYEPRSNFEWSKWGKGLNKYSIWTERHNMSLHDACIQWCYHSAIYVLGATLEQFWSNFVTIFSFFPLLNWINRKNQIHMEVVIT